MHPDRSVHGRRRAMEQVLLSPFDYLLRHRGPVKLFLHLGIFLTAYIFAFLLRFEFEIPPAYWTTIRETILLLIVAKAIGFLAFGLFQGWWRYVSIRDILPVTAGCLTGTALFGGSVYLLWGTYHVPRSVYVLDFGITLLMVLSARYLIRMGREAFGRSLGEYTRSVLIVGAGAAGQMIAREIWDNPALGIIAVGFVDDDRAKIGTRIQGLKVLGDHERIEEVCSAYEVDEVIIAIPSAPARVSRHIMEHCRNISGRVRTLPGVGELIDGKVGVKDLRNVRLEDLLGREPVTLDAELLRRDITGSCVMVTGAAGSIGSELCRQVARLMPSRLVMFDVSESPVYELELEMREMFPRLDLVPMIGDIRDRRRVEGAISTHLPAVIYHAAAYKHVPVMETHPAEAVKTNVLGTRIVAEVAVEHGVKRFVLVSTDKAVRPANVMGATKRVAEIIVQNMSGKAENTVFVAVRFGNVLDSVGSVIPIFRRQLETTGKLTVTHPEASRYFMLIPEACGLILQAGAMGRGGEIFVLDMGEPIRIVDLARNMIRLSGREEGVDAEIVFTGLRPGEKLREELVIEGEDVTRTVHPKVMKLIGNGPMDQSWHERLGRLVESAASGNGLGVVRELDDLVPGYTPDYRFHGLPPAAEPHPADLPQDLTPSVFPLPSKSIH